MRDFLKKFANKRPQVETLEELERFLAQQAAYVSQRGTLEYCRIRAGLHWDKLMLEDMFAEAMDLCQWESYAAVASDLGILVEGYLRPYFPGNRKALGDIVARCHERALRLYPDPQGMPGGWQPEIERFRERLAQAQIAEPRPISVLGQVSGKRIFKVLPIHPRLRSHDGEMIENHMRLAVIGVHDEMNRRVNAKAIFASLASAGGSEPAAS